MVGILLAILAGLCAALASVFAKLAMASESTLALCQLTSKYLEEILLLYEITNASFYLISILDCDQIVSYIRIICFGMIFLCNALMWTLFVKAMQKCSSTVEATLINTASNLAFTAILGYLLFAENLSLLWWIGMSFIVIGMCLIMQDSDTCETETIKKEM